jgi:hypothetical protein
VSERVSEQKLKDSFEYFVAQFRGRKCLAVELLDDLWCFRFGEETPFFEVSCPWRIRDRNCVKVGSDDRRQKSASPAPLDVRAEALSLFGHRDVINISIAPVIADVTIEFERGLWLDIFNGSGSYEDWSGRASSSTRVVYMVAMGGGEIAVWDDPIASAP